MVKATRFALLLCFVTLASAPASATTPADDVLRASEQRVKAAFLFKFGDYVEWPLGSFDSPGDSMVIGVVGSDAIAGELATLVAGRSMGGRPVVVRRLKLRDVGSTVDVLFVGRDAVGELGGLLSPLRGRAILVVTESPQGLVAGGVINFVVVADKVRFDVSLPSAAARGLKVSSRLLVVARRVLAAPP
jgi:hypothetical protein